MKSERVVGYIEERNVVASNMLIDVEDLSVVLFDRKRCTQCQSLTFRNSS